MRRLALITTTFILLATNIQVSAHPTAQEGAMSPHGMHQGHAMRHGDGGMDMSFMGRGLMHQASPEEVERMVTHWMKKINGTTEQTTKIMTLVREVQKDLKPMREKIRELHEKKHSALLGQTVDRGALEAIRKEDLLVHDQSSARMNRFLADASQVLSAEQRAQIHQHLRERRARWQQAK